MLVTKLSTSFQQICQNRLFAGSPYMTLFNFGAIRCAVHILPEVIEFGTVGILRFQMNGCQAWTFSKEIHKKLRGSKNVIPLSNEANLIGEKEVQ